MDSQPTCRSFCSQWIFDGPKASKCATKSELSWNSNPISRKYDEDLSRWKSICKLLDTRNLSFLLAIINWEKKMPQENFHFWFRFRHSIPIFAKNHMMNGHWQACLVENSPMKMFRVLSFHWNPSSQKTLKKGESVDFLRYPGFFQNYYLVDFLKQVFIYKDEFLINYLWFCIF